MKNTCLGFCIALLAVVRAPAAVPGESAPEASPDAVFAFANDSGTDLLAGSSEESSGKVAVKAISQAICPGNRILDVTFSRHQAHSAKDNGRQTSGNFRNLEGDVFHIVRGQAKADETCLLVTRDYMQDKRLVSLRTPGMTPEGLPAKPATCDAEMKKNIPNQPNRAPVSCWQLAKIGDNGRLVAVNYEPRQRNLLAALVLQMGGRSMIHKMPATADSTSAWREGDGGNFDPTDFPPCLRCETKKMVPGKSALYGAARRAVTFLSIAAKVHCSRRLSRDTVTGWPNRGVSAVSTQHSPGSRVAWMTFLGLIDKHRP